jgi:phosphoribosylformylglycinamidine synthase
VGETALLLVDLGAGKNRLGGSALAQVFGQLGDVPPDLDDPARLKGFFAAIQELSSAGKLLAYHDRSDGGLFVTLLEMAFAGGTGVTIELPPGAAMRWRSSSAKSWARWCKSAKPMPPTCAPVSTATGWAAAFTPAASSRPTGEIAIRKNGQVLFTEKRSVLRGIWSETTLAMQSLRDDPTCAAQEQESRCDASDPGLVLRPSFDAQADVAAPFIARGAHGRAWPSCANKA